MAFRSNIYKTAAELALMVEPGLITAAALDAVRAAIRPGITTLELHAVAEKVIRDAGAEPNFMLVPGYRHTICASVNEEVVHGIPGARVLQPGDLVSIDCGAQLAGWNGDSAFSVVVPDPSRPDLVAERQRLSDVTEQSLWHGVAALASVKRLNQVGAAIEQYIESQGDFGIIEDYTGHGIGSEMHMAPDVPNYRTNHRGPKIRPGLCLAIEPMLVRGSIETAVLDDDWTVVTTDGKRSCQWEHSVAVHEQGIWVLSAPDGGAAKLAPLGVVPVPIP